MFWNFFFFPTFFSSWIFRLIKFQTLAMESKRNPEMTKGWLAALYPSRALDALTDLGAHHDKHIWRGIQELVRTITMLTLLKNMNVQAYNLQADK